MNVANLEVLHGLVARKNPNQPQLIQVSLTTEDINSGVADLKWHNVLSNGTVEEPFATANLYYCDANDWLSSWAPLTHLILGRIDDLNRMADEGTANRLSRKMAYQLFANSLVDYASKYRGMQSVVLNGLEAYAEVQLSTEKGGTWTVPPFFIDSVCHLAGFIMNCSDAMDTKANFCTTPGWGTMRFARTLVPGAKYRSYTKMIPTAQDPTVYLGDVYVLQDDIIIGMVGSIKFRRYPRILLNRFFTAPDDEKAGSRTGATTSVSASATPPAPKPKLAQPEAASKTAVPVITAAPKAQPDIPKAAASQVTVTPTVPTVKPAATVTPAAAPVNADSTAAKAIALVANEAALDIEDLVDEASFASLGIDSLMSLVLAEKFREELGVTVGGSLFLEYPTMGDLRAWLEEYYS